MIGRFPLRLSVLVLGSMVAVAGCGGSPVAPSPAAPSGEPPPPSVHVVTGTVVDALSEAALPGVVVSVDGAGDVTTGPDGRFVAEVPDRPDVPVGLLDGQTMTLASSTTVPRETRVRIPGPPARLSLIPEGFDLTAFDEMFRPTGFLQRWVVAPAIVVQRRVLRFTSATYDEFDAMDLLMSEEQASELLAQLASALPDLTGGRFGTFASVQQETAAVGERVNVKRVGAIVVAQYFLLRDTGYRGFGRVATDVTRAVQAGVIMLDRTFETSGSELVRVVRVHDLGHALGYGHVATRESIMNPTAQPGLEVNAFDRDAATVGFERAPGNRAPDIDSGTTVANPGAVGNLVWAPPLP